MLNRMTRRRFLASAAAIPALVRTRSPSQAQTEAPALLRAVTRTIEVNGKAARVYGLIGPDGRHGLDLLYGQDFNVRLRNEIDAETLIHWHGLTPPSAQDGVPMLSQAPLKPGESFDYNFPIKQAGTFWMHSHIGLQEQQMLAAPLIIRETGKPLWDEQEHVVMLHDFTFRDPKDILAELRGGGGAHAGHAVDHSMMDHSAGAQPQAAEMLNDVEFDAFLANERTLDDPEVVSVEKRGVVRLRIINAAAASNMWVDLGALEGELIAVDGISVHPLRHSVFPLAIAQRADIRVSIPEDGGAFPILFRPEGLNRHTGIILATPGAKIGRQAETGAVAPPLSLEMEAKLRGLPVLPDKPVTRTEMLMLTGGGADYAWGLNGKSGMHETLFTVREGDRIEVMMHNMTGMAHPMHLHGHYFKVTAIGNRRIGGAVRDTVLVPPMERVTITFDADNPGSWAFHCHHIYHMNAGMMGAIAYASAA